MALVRPSTLALSEIQIAVEDLVANIRREQSTGFSAKLYDAQFRNARGGLIPPPDSPRYEKCPDRASVNKRSINSDFQLSAFL